MAEQLDIDELLEEVSRYLSAVDTFRAERREPTWLAEQKERQQARATAAARGR